MLHTINNKRQLLCALLILCAGIGISAALIAHAETGSTDVNFIVAGCNNNAICEPIIGEDATSCPADCSAVTPPATSTPSNPSNSGGTGGNGGTGYETTIYGISTVTTKDSAVINWKTSLPSLTTLSWGKTTEYEQGSLSEISYFIDHSASLQNLLPNTLYYYTITARFASGATAATSSTFITKRTPEEIPPFNVINFNAYPYNGGIGLEWQNPNEHDFANVRIVRSPYAYPLDPNQGKIMYEGTGNFFADTTITPDTYYYYANFVRDTAGNYSSGALARSIVRTKPVNSLDNGTGVPIQTGGGTGSGQGQNTGQGSATTTSSASQPSLINVDFIQNGRKLSFVQSDVPIDSEDTLVISIDTARVPDAKRITISINTPEGERLYMFEKSDRGYWIAALPSGMFSGSETFTITVENYHTPTQSIKGTFKAQNTSIEANRLSYEAKTLLLIGSILGLLFLFWFIILFKRRRREEEREKQ